jgi:hypothetical protein
MKTKLVAVVALGLWAVGSVGSAATVDTGMPCRITGTWEHTETYLVRHLMLRTDWTYSYESWSLGGEVQEAGAYSYAGGLLTLVPSERHATGCERLGGDAPRVAVLAWSGCEQLTLRFTDPVEEGASLLLSRG